MPEDKLWYCDGCRAALGKVTRNGNGIRVLEVFRHPDEPADIVCEVQGFTRVCCEACGGVRIWVPGQDALDRIIKRSKGRG